MALVGLSAARGGAFHITATGVVWLPAASLLFTVFMYALAETVASGVNKEEDYVGAVPVLAILPFFFAGALLHSVTTEAWLSLAVVAVYAAALIAVAIRAFERSAVK